MKKISTLFLILGLFSICLEGQKKKSGGLGIYISYRIHPKYSHHTETFVSFSSFFSARLIELNKKERTNFTRQHEAVVKFMERYAEDKLSTPVIAIFVDPRETFGAVLRLVEIERLDSENIKAEANRVADAAFNAIMKMDGFLTKKKARNNVGVFPEKRTPLLI